MFELVDTCLNFLFFDKLQYKKLKSVNFKLKVPISKLDSRI